LLVVNPSGQKALTCPRSIVVSLDENAMREYRLTGAEPTGVSPIYTWAPGGCELILTRIILYGGGIQPWTNTESPKSNRGVLICPQRAPIAVDASSTQSPQVGQAEAQTASCVDVDGQSSGILFPAGVKRPQMGLTAADSACNSQQDG